MKNFELSTFLTDRLYTSKNRSKFFGFSQAVAFVSVMLGSMALVISLSVLEGFQETLHKVSTIFTSHIQLTTYNRESIIHTDELRNKIERENSNVHSTYTVLQKEVLIRCKSNIEGVVLKSYSQMPSNSTGTLRFIEGDDTRFLPEASICIGEKLARKLEVTAGDSVIILVPPTDVNNITTSVVKKYKVAGIYRSGMAQYDDSFVYTQYSTLEQLLDLSPNTATHIEIMTKNYNQLKQTSNEISESIGFPFYTITVQELHAGMFAWIEMQKQPIPIVLGLISVVAVFNIFTTLLISVVEKSHSIAILLSLGIQKRTLRYILITRGLFIGIFGTAVGCSLGFLICWIQLHYSIIHLKGEIYFIDTLPIKFEISHFVIVVLSSIFMSLLSTIIPAIIATRIDPIKSLRFK